MSEVRNIGLDQAFDVESVPAKVDPIDEERRRFEERVDSDYAFARENVMNTILKAQDIIDELSSLASSSQHPRAYEVLGQIIKTVVDSNLNLMDLAKKSKDLKQGAGAPAQSIGTVNNNLLISNADLLEMLKNNGVSSGIKNIENIKKSDTNE